MLVIRKPLLSLRQTTNDVAVGAFSIAFSTAFDIEPLYPQQFSSAFSQDFATIAANNNQFTNAFSSAFANRNS